MTMTNFDKIKEFHAASGLALADTPQYNVFENKKLTDLRVALIMEEVGELLDAAKQKDHKEIIDALSDILYVVYGAGASFGIDLNQSLIDRLVRKKMCDPNNIEGKTNFEIVCERINEQWTDDGVVIQSTIDYDAMNNDEIAKAMMFPIYKWTQQLERRVFDKDFEGVQSSLTKILAMVYAVGARFRVDLDKSYDIVHSSNMTKFCLTEDLAQRTVESYEQKYQQLKEEHNYPDTGIEEDIQKWQDDLKTRNINVYDSASYRKSSDGKYFVVFNDSTKKILKSIEYTPADFATLL
jgi:predicted HAD superfamily Cof-like phosphohydrolase